MKSIISHLISGVFGGVIVLAGIYLLKTPMSAITSNSAFAIPVKNINVPPIHLNAPTDFKAAAAKATPAVVHIKATKTINPSQRNDDPWSQMFGHDFFFGSPFGRQLPQEGSGSGVIYTSDGYIITNNHVVEFADQIEITTHNNKTYTATKVGTYPQSDLAILKIDAIDLPTLQLADSDEATIGEWVLAVGNPLELKSTVTAGIISAKGRDIDIIKDSRGSAIESFIQTDAAVNPGNSGGALVDKQGRLLGINTAIATRTGYFQGYSFAIPVNVVVNIANNIIENGSYERGFMGIEIADLTNEDVTELGLTISQGVLIDEVEKDGAAYQSGIFPNDVIVGANNKTVNTVPELLEIIGTARAGEVVVLKINRYGKMKIIDVVLKRE